MSVYSNMWSIRKLMDGVSSIFSPNKNQTQFTDEEYRYILFSDIVNEKKEEDEKNAVCQRRTGTITRLEADYGLIDNTLYFELTDLQQKNVKCGQIVSFVAYRKNENVEWKIKQINVIEKEEWAEVGSPKEASGVLSKNLAMPKTITAQILKKKARMLTLSIDKFICSLDRLQAEFLPMEGDWVTINAIVEVKENNKVLEHCIIDVESLKPMKSRTYEGKITHLSQNEMNETIGIISNEIYFTENIYEAGYHPEVNDKVVARVIESEQGKLNWRAISMTAVEGAYSNDLLSKIKEERLFDSKNGIGITANCLKKALKVGEIATFEICVDNCSPDNQVLVNVELKNAKRNDIFQLIDPFENPVLILSGESYHFNVDAAAYSPGYFSDTLLFCFKDNLEMRSLLDIYVDIEEELNKQPRNKVELKDKQLKNSRFEKHVGALKKTFATPTGFMVPGQRPGKISKFIPRQLPVFRIPDIIRQILSCDGRSYEKNSDIEADLLKTYPTLAEELTPENYRHKFHTLLHLENCEIETAIKKYDRDRAYFEKRGEYLSLEMPNLAENRPSLVIGDKLIATDPFAKKDENSIHYEGYVHKVLATEIRLKFNESFHTFYDGKDYSVTFIPNRTSMRRYHQAIEVVVGYGHPGFDWLFPKSINLKSVQVNIEGEYPPLSSKDEKHVCQTESEDDSNKLHIVNEQTGSDENSKLVAFANSTDSEDECSEDEKMKPEKNEMVDDIPKKIHEYATDRQETKEVNIQWETDDHKKVKGDQPIRYRPAIKPKAETGRVISPNVILKWVNTDLNRYQRQAVRNILKGEARPLPYIVFGPPGTGKTVTVVETILQILFLMPDSRILVATPSNSSADLICERLLSWNLLKPGDLIRLVGYNYCIDARMSSVVKPYCTVIDTGSEKYANSSTFYDNEGIKFSSREMVGRHRITVSTCSSVGNLYMSGFPKSHFTHIVVDEAGQATEPEIMVPFAFLSNTGQAILAGDSLQLGPVIISRFGDAMGLGDSFLSRLSIRFPYHRDPESFPETDGYDPRLVTRLLYNYRSLPNILNLYSTLFYESNLIAKVCDRCSCDAKFVCNVKEDLRTGAKHKPSEVLFFGVRGVNKQDNDSPSWYNEQEISRISFFVMQLYNRGVSADDMGIVTPYQKQVVKLRDMLKDCQIPIPKIGTVEEFQGQERKVIFVSTVRSDETLLERDKKFALGFVGHKQRINVAISRARALLVIVGNPYLLATNNTWKSLIRLCYEKGNYVGCDLPSSLED